MSGATILALALVLDAAVGEPRWVWSRLPHPAVLMGRAVDWIDRKFNHGDQRRTRGMLSFSLLCTGALALGIVPQMLPFSWLIEIALVAILLAHKSLVSHVADVSRALRLSVADGRLAVARIVGRDITDMGSSEISRAAIESAAENLSDAVIAPALWFLIAGLPGLLLYKLVNTADSMIGHRNQRYAEFGWAAARFDDLMNWIPARLTALLIALISASRAGHDEIRKDAELHRSPNAGWPEAAMARALDVALSGPRSYGGRMQNFPFVHEKGTHTSGPDDIDAAVRVLWKVWGLTMAIVVILAAF